MRFKGDAGFCQAAIRREIAVAALKVAVAPSDASTCAWLLSRFVRHWT